MQLGVAEARRRFSELLDLVARGGAVEVLRRGRVVAVLAPPVNPGSNRIGFDEAVASWRREWGVDEWPDDGTLDDLRDPSPGPVSPW